MQSSYFKRHSRSVSTQRARFNLPSLPTLVNILLGGSLMECVCSFAQVFDKDESGDISVIEMHKVLKAMYPSLPRYATVSASNVETSSSSVIEFASCSFEHTDWYV